jgi:hypothetical protein
MLRKLVLAAALLALGLSLGCASDGDKDPWGPFWKDLRGDNMQMRGWSDNSPAQKWSSNEPASK